MQIALTIFYIVWLIAVLVFLGLIWRDTRSHIHRMERALVEVAMKSAEAAHTAAEAARRQAALLEKKINA